MEKVYLVMKRESVDYHGSYETVMSVCGNEQLAKTRVAELIADNHIYDIEYYYETYEIENK